MVIMLKQLLIHPIMTSSTLIEIFWTKPPKKKTFKTKVLLLKSELNVVKSPMET